MLLMKKSASANMYYTTIALRVLANMYYTTISLGGLVYEVAGIVGVHGTGKVSSTVVPYLGPNWGLLLVCRPLRPSSLHPQGVVANMRQAA